MKRLWQIGNMLALVFALLANYAVSAQILDVPSINTVSDSSATYLTPAAYAFSIWSLIYLLLIILVVYQARDIHRPQNENDLPARLGPFFIMASICNGLWTYVFVKGYIGVSVLVLLLLTASLYVLLGRLKIAVDDPPPKSIFCVWWPLMIYTGWVTVASVVNVASWLESLNVLVTPRLASAVLLALGALLFLLLFRRNVREVVLTGIWGIVAIGVRQLQLADSRLVVTTAFAVAGVLFIATVVHVYRNRHATVLAKLRA